VCGGDSGPTCVRSLSYYIGTQRTVIRHSGTHARTRARARNPPVVHLVGRGRFERGDATASERWRRRTNGAQDDAKITREPRTRSRARVIPVEKAHTAHTAHAAHAAPRGLCVDMSPADEALDVIKYEVRRGDRHSFECGESARVTMISSTDDDL
jgi:hypothetical protein